MASYVEELGPHGSVEIRAAGHGRVRAVCACGWRSPMSRRFDQVARSWSAQHVTVIEKTWRAVHCSSCRCELPEPGDYCERCDMVLASITEGA